MVWAGRVVCLIAFSIYPPPTLNFYNYFPQNQLAVTTSVPMSFSPRPPPALPFSHFLWSLSVVILLENPRTSNLISRELGKKKSKPWKERRVGFSLFKYAFRFLDCEFPVLMKILNSCTQSTLLKPFILSFAIKVKTKL